MADAYARLMSDFSQMTAWGRGLESDLSWARAELLMVKAEVERLTKQVERLTKAGDVMANRLMYQGYHLTIPQWNEAKDLYPRD